MEYDLSTSIDPFWYQISSVSAHLDSGRVGLPEAHRGSDLSPASESREPVTINSDQIYVPDVGVDSRERAFHWLALGHNMLDDKGNEIRILDLELEVDPEGTMPTGLRRGILWKKTSPKMWQAEDHEKGVVPSQPVIDERSQSICYSNDKISDSDRQLSAREAWVASIRRKFPPAEAAVLIALPPAQLSNAPSFATSFTPNGSAGEIQDAPSTLPTVLSASTTAPSLLVPAPPFASGSTPNRLAGEIHHTPSTLAKTSSTMTTVPSKLATTSTTSTTTASLPSVPLSQATASLCPSSSPVRNQLAYSETNTSEDDGNESDSSTVSCTRSESYLTNSWRGVNYYVAEEPEDEVIPEYKHSPDMSQLRSLISSQPRKRSIHDDSGIALNWFEAPSFPAPAENLKPRRFVGRRYSGPL